MKSCTATVVTEGLMLVWPGAPVPALEPTEKAMIRAALARTGSRAQAAQLLGLRREQLRSRMRRYRLKAP